MTTWVSIFTHDSSNDFPWHDMASPDRATASWWCAAQCIAWCSTSLREPVKRDGWSTPKLDRFGPCRASVAGLSWKKWWNLGKTWRFGNRLPCWCFARNQIYFLSQKAATKLNLPFVQANLNQENPVRFSGVYWCNPPQCSYPQSNIASIASWDIPEINGHFNGSTGQPSNQLHITWGVSIRTCSITKG